MNTYKEKHQCMVCGILFETGKEMDEIDLREDQEDPTVTDESLCTKHKKVIDDGMIALVEAIPETNVRTGKILFIPADGWSTIFGKDRPAPEVGVTLVTKDTMKSIRALMSLAEVVFKPNKNGV